jgi:hypothetical protein
MCTKFTQELKTSSTERAKLRNFYVHAIGSNYLQLKIDLMREYEVVESILRLLSRLRMKDSKLSTQLIPPNE